MTKRLATACLMTMFLVGSSPAARAQSSVAATLKGINTVYVLVEDLPPGAKVLGLAKETIQTDVELKLRLAGIRVVTREESFRLPGAPYLYVNLNLADSAQNGGASVELKQNVFLERNGEFAYGVATWETGIVMRTPTAQFIRNSVKDMVDQFLNAWLSVNPKK